MLINSYPDHWKSALDVRINELLHQFPEAHLYVLIEGVFDETSYPPIKAFSKAPLRCLVRHHARCG
jgi:hypothetical protein